MEDDSIDGLVVDANIISEFIKDHSSQGETYKLINIILDNYGIVVTEKIEREWINTTGNQVFDAWFSQFIMMQKIKFLKNFKIKISPGEKKTIHNKYGLPRDRSKDIEYIKCAVNTDIKYILTEDIHFYDPKKKEASPKEKIRIKKERNGKFCKFLSKQYSIKVGLPDHCYQDLNLRGSDANVSTITPL